jgi:predicted transposase YbfD/YdcC
VPSSPLDVLTRHLEHVTITDPPADLPALAEILDTIPDPRSRRGRRYRLGPLPALSLLAVLGGATSLVKIARFIAGYDLSGHTRRLRPARHPWQPARRADPAVRPGRGRQTLRGSRTGDGTVHLLAATCHNPQIVVAQRQVEAENNEILAFTPLLSHLDLTGVVVTADALHTQHDHARHVIAAGGHYLFIVKGNQPTLLRRLKALPWREAVLNDRTDEQGHGRREIRRTAWAA